MHVDVVDFGCVVLVISEPIEALPLSELALQLPLEEWGSSLPAERLCRLCAELSRNFTVTFVTAERGVAIGKLILDFSEEDREGFRSCVDFRSLFTLRVRRVVTVSYMLMSSMSLVFVLSFPDLDELLLLNCFKRFLPHCFKLLKCDFLISGESRLFVRSTSLLLLLQTTSMVAASGSGQAAEESSLANN